MESKDSSIATSEVTCFKRGMLNDPEIRLNYPDTSVVCYQPTQPASISIEHQSEFCLCENFVNCPVYQRKAVAPPPAETGGGLFSDIRTWVLVPVVLIGLIVGVFFLLSPQNSIANPASTPVEQVDAFGTETATATATEEVETNGIDTAPTELDTLTPTRDSLFPDLDVSVAAETSTPTPTKLPTATKTLRPTRTPIPTRTPKPSETETPTRRATSSSNSNSNSGSNSSSGNSNSNSNSGGVTIYPTATTKWVVKSATSTPNFAATQAVNNSAATAQAKNAQATWTAQNAQQTVVAQQTYTALGQIRAQQTAAAVSAQQTAAAVSAQQAAAAVSVQQTTAAAAAAATRNAWNASVTLTAQAVQTIEAVPPSDRDGDSIPDTEDSCPDQYGIPEYDGCNPFEGGGDGGGDGGGSGGGGDDGRD